MQELQLNLDHQNFYCPVTGDAILSEDRYQPSAATVFTYVDEIGDFQDLSPELESIVDELSLGDSDASLFERLRQRLKDEHLVCFNLAIRGMGYGSEVARVRIGINMNYSPAYHDS